MRKKIRKNSLKTVAKKTGIFLNKHTGILSLVLLIGVMVTGVASAAPDAEGLWSAIQTLIGTWVSRLGGVVMFVGIIMFGLGWKSDDAEQKSRGIGTIISGAIVLAAAVMIGTFFA